MSRLIGNPINYHGMKMTFGQRVRLARETATPKLSQAELGKAIGGMKQPSIAVMESNPNVKSSKYAYAIAKATGVNIDWLQAEEGPMRNGSSINQQMKNTASHPDPLINLIENRTTNSSAPELLKVLGMAEGGKDGWNIWNGETVQVINRPDNLIGVKDAYGVLVRGTSMAPRYDPNMIAHIHPWMHPEPGDYVVVQRKPFQEGEPPLAVLKRLVRRTARVVVLAQLSPSKELEVPAADVVSIHKVVGSSNA